MASHSMAGGLLAGDVSGVRERRNLRRGRRKGGGGDEREREGEEEGEREIEGGR